MAKERAIAVGAGGISRARFGPLVAEQGIEEFALTGAVPSDDLTKTLREVNADFLVDMVVDGDL